MPKWRNHVKSLHLIWPPLRHSGSPNEYVYADQTLSVTVSSLPRLETLSMAMETFKPDLWASFPRSKSSILHHSSATAFSLCIHYPSAPISSSVLDAFGAGLTVLEIECPGLVGIEWAAAITRFRDLDTLRFYLCYPAYEAGATPTRWLDRIRDFQFAYPCTERGEPVKMQAVRDLLQSNADTLENLVMTGHPKDDLRSTSEEDSYLIPFPRLRSLACLLEQQDIWWSKWTPIKEYYEVRFSNTMNFVVADSLIELTELKLSVHPNVYIRLAAGLLKGDFRWSSGSASSGMSTTIARSKKWVVRRFVMAATLGVSRWSGRVGALEEERQKKAARLRATMTAGLITDTQDCPDAGV